MDGWNTCFLGWPIFRGYVSFREGMAPTKIITYDVSLETSNAMLAKALSPDFPILGGVASQYVPKKWGGDTQMMRLCQVLLCRPVIFL